MDFAEYHATRLFKEANWSIPEDFLSKDHFLRVINDKLNRQSSPGIPFCRDAPTNGQWLGFDGLQYNPDKIEELWYWVKEVINGNFNHVYRAFVKDEVHNGKKAREGRWRLILASSLPVQVVWHMCFDEMNDNMARRPYSTPAGYGLVYPGGGWKRFRNYLQGNKMNLCIDKSAWDFNAPGWVFQVILKVRRNLCVNIDTPQGQKWWSLVKMLYTDAYFKSKISMPSGIIFQQTFVGFMKSGLVNTISDNSIAQVLLHILASKRTNNPILPIKSTGDDTIQRMPENLEEYLAELEMLGCKVKEFHIGYQFMGFNLEDFSSMYPDKHIAGILYKTKEVLKDTLDDYVALYANTTTGLTSRFWRIIMQKQGMTPRLSDFEAKYWLNNPDALERY